jgi:hypothetical protein
VSFGKPAVEMERFIRGALEWDSYAATKIIKAIIDDYTFNS